MSSDLPGVNPATLNRILLYYRLMTKWSGLGDSTELSRVGLSQCPCRATSEISVITPSDGCPVLMVNSCIKVHMVLQADKSPVVVKGPFFPRVVNPRYRIRGTMCNARIQSSKARKAI
jgi:hypothetical protein